LLLEKGPATAPTSAAIARFKGAAKRPPGR
jgi:hypothetical protein